ncbi:MAG: adenine phosphoribosyltransferase [Thaumarchaeota archaeon]|nr:adenine phosphoribosyltransferase [Nitrososphaerota archaeon]
MEIKNATGQQTLLPYKGQSYYDLEINGLKWRLPLIQVSPDTWIAYFDSLGDARFVNTSAEALAKHLRGCEVLMTSESKGVPLTHAIATRLGHNLYIVCRKEKKPFMVNPLTVTYRPVTSTKSLELCIDSRYVDKIKGKQVGLVDDIVSTKGTLDAMMMLVEKAGGVVTKKAAVLTEGKVYDDIISLGVLPIFKK